MPNKHAPGCKCCKKDDEEPETPPCVTGCTPCCCAMPGTIHVILPGATNGDDCDLCDEIREFDLVHTSGCEWQYTEEAYCPSCQEEAFDLIVTFDVSEFEGSCVATLTVELHGPEDSDCRGDVVTWQLIGDDVFNCRGITNLPHSSTSQDGPACAVWNETDAWVDCSAEECECAPEDCECEDCECEEEENEDVDLGDEEDELLECCVGAEAIRLKERYNVLLPLFTEAFDTTGTGNCAFSVVDFVNTQAIFTMNFVGDDNACTAYYDTIFPTPTVDPSGCGASNDHSTLIGGTPTTRYWAYAECFCGANAQPFNVFSYSIRCEMAVHESCAVNFVVRFGSYVQPGAGNGGGVPQSVVTILYDGQIDDGEILGNICGGGGFLVPYTSHTNFNGPPGSLPGDPGPIAIWPD